MGGSSPIRGALLGACLCCGAAAAAQPPVSPRKVLILSSYHPGFLWTDQVMHGLMEVLTAEDPTLELHVEYMDWKRFPTEENLQRLLGLFRYKYAGETHDLVVTVDNGALEAALRWRSELFPDASILFCGISGIAELRSRLPPFATGVAEVTDPGATLATAFRLHPRARDVLVVVDGSDSGQHRRREVEDAIVRLGSRARFRFTTDMEMPEILREVDDLAADDFILMMGYNRSAAGAVYGHAAAVRLVAARSRVPIYHAWDWALGRGVIGGHLVAGRAHGEEAARMALRMLDGEPASAIPVHVPACPPMFDHRQLQRFDIADSALPVGSLVVNRPESFYDKYRTRILATLAAIVMLVGLNLALVTSMRRRRRAEAALRESEQLLRAVFEQAALGVGITDLSGRFLDANPSLLCMLGYDVEELKQLDVAAVTHPEDWERERPHFQGLCAGTVDSASYEKRCIRKDGQVVWVNVAAGVLRDPAGRPHLTLGLVEDITARKQREAEQREMEAQIRHTQRLESLGVLAGGIAHDFNNLLAGVLGNADLALAELPSGLPVRGRLEDIKKTSLRAAELTRQMLAYSGKGKLLVQPVNLNALVRELGELLRVSLSKKAVVRYELAPELSPVEADAAQLNQVVMNLITNASDALEDRPGTIVLRTGVMPADRAYLASTFVDDHLPPGRYVYVEVEDDGCGMPPEALPHVFEPFFTTKFKGRGLGLSAVLGIVRGHQGAVRVESEPGRGTVFRVLFRASGAASIAEQASSGEAPRPPVPGCVLVVDDDDVVRAVLAAMLRTAGYDVLVARDGAEAVELFRARHQEVALVVLDLTMPRLGGEEVLLALRASRPDLPVLLTSGHPENESVRRLADRPAAFLQKPFTREALLAKLQVVLGARN